MAFDIFEVLAFWAWPSSLDFLAFLVEVDPWGKELVAFFLIDELLLLCLSGVDLSSMGSKWTDLLVESE